MLPEFRPWPKIARYNKPLIITEKIDGTNAVIHVSEDGQTLTAGSRTRWLGSVTIVGGDPEAREHRLFDKDNFGFSAWTAWNALELLRLGPGYHYGEWYGQGIQRTYGLHEKRFALFNVSRWADPAARPACCGVVPVLPSEIPAALALLREKGSVAVPGFMKPEGIVVFHTGSSTPYKILLEGDDVPKGLVA